MEKLKLRISVLCLEQMRVISLITDGQQSILLDFKDNKELKNASWVSTTPGGIILWIFMIWLRKKNEIITLGEEMESVSIKNNLYLHTPI